MSRFFVYIILFFCLLIAVGLNVLYGVISLIRRLRHRPKPRYQYCFFTIVMAILLTISTIGYGYFIGRWQLRKTEVVLTYDSLPPAFDGYTIVHLSDLHLSSFVGHEDQLNRIIDSVLTARPDLICFTGDLISLDTTEVALLAPVLDRLKAKDGVVSVLGNHDFMPYGKEQPDWDSVAVVMTRLETDMLGWRVLNNDHILITRAGEHITIAGCMNQSDESFPFLHLHQHPPLRMGDLDKALEGTDGFRILLTHDPSQWHNEIKETERTDIALTLSGHTHCGQLRLGSWTPAYWFFEEVKGLYKTTKPVSLYVNTGLGCTAPIRLGVPMEVTVIKLNHH